jgi:pimeloyl-ACP methyl ester carboxylesterase
MFEFQASLIFPTHSVPSAGPLPRGAEELSLETPDGHTLAGIHIPADRRTRSKPLILGFGGNGWNGQDVAEYIHELYPDHDVVVFHYRGYAPSTGSPSAEALMADAPLVYDFVVGKIKTRKLIGVGFSIGTAVAARLSAERKLEGLILVTPFDSLKAVAQSMFPWLPIGPFFSHEMDAAEALENSKVPVAIVSAQHDQIVPTERTDALRKRVGNLVFDRTISGSGHNDIYARSEFHRTMDDALNCLET